MAGDQQASMQQLAQHQTAADQASRADFGVNSIGPTVAPGSLRATVASAPPPALSVSPVAAAGATLPAKCRTEFDEGVAPLVTEPVSEQLSGYRQQRATYKRTAEETQKAGDRQIQEESARARVQQLALRQQAAADVSGERKRWQAENRKIGDDFGANASTRRTELNHQIHDRVNAANVETGTRLTEAEAAAEAERKKADAEAAARKSDLQQKPKSFWDSVKDDVSSVFESVKSAVNAVFDRLRQAVKAIIDAAKAAVRAVLDAARRAVVDLIQAFGEVLKGLISVALAAFPAAAARARAWIDARVKAAVSAVNRAAEALMRAAEAILDGLAKTLDAALSVLQTVFVGALGALQKTANAVFDGMQALARLAAWLEKNARFLEGARKVMENPDQIIESMKATLGEMIGRVPQAADAKLKEFSGQLGGRPAPAAAIGSGGGGSAVVQREAAVELQPAKTTRHVSALTHINGVTGCLEKGLEYLKAHWWDELKKVGWNLLWPWPAVWGDLQGMWAEILSANDDVRHLRASAVIDHVLTMEQKLNSIMGNLYGWFFIGSVLVGTIIGAFFGGAGAIPGALAGAAVAGEAGEALVAALIATETLVILKGLADLAIGNASAEADQQDYEKIGGSLLTISITGALMLLGEIAADLAKGVWEGVAGLVRGDAPKVDVKVDVEPGKGEPDTAPNSPPEKNVVAERTTPDGHTIKVLEDGRAVICTTCEELRFRYEDELKADSKLQQALDDANRTVDPRVKADKLAKLKAALDGKRIEMRSVETPEAKVQALDSVLEHTHQALGRLRELLRDNSADLIKANGALKSDVEAGLRELTNELDEAEASADAIKDDPELRGLADDYRQKVEDIGAKANDLSDRVNDSVTDTEPTEQTPAPRKSGYQPAPRELPAYPDARGARPKTPVQGGGGLRRRWVDSQGNIYEWDSQHGAVERYNPRGRHLGEFDPDTGAQTKPADPTRTVEP
jgi:hypothetical protein